MHIMAWWPQGLLCWTKLVFLLETASPFVQSWVDSRARLSRNRLFSGFRRQLLRGFFWNSSLSSPSVVTGSACPCTLPSASLSPSAPSPSPEAVSPPCSIGHRYISINKPKSSELKVVAPQLLLQHSLPFFFLYTLIALFIVFIYITYM